MRKMAFAASAVAIVAVVLGGVVAATASSDLSSPRTITVMEKDTQSHFVDVGASGLNLGDSFVFSGVLRHAGKRVGHDGAECTLVHAHPAKWQCEATYKLPGGEITGQVLVHFTKPPQTFLVAVNGGTNVFRNARGQATIKALTDTTSRDTFNLIP